MHVESRGKKCWYLVQGDILVEWKNWYLNTEPELLTFTLDCAVFLSDCQEPLKTKERGNGPWRNCEYRKVVYFGTVVLDGIWKKGP